MTDTRSEFHELLSRYVPVMLAVVAIVFALVVFALVRYRRGRGHEPSKREEAPLAESLYVLALSGIAAALLFSTFRVENRVDRVAHTAGLTVNVVAFKWQWRFSYPGRGVRAIVGTERREPTLVVPTRTRILFRLTARDVIHALWIPALRFKRDAFPERTTRFDLVFAKPGTYVGRCAEFCGLDHADMTFRVRALPRREFDAWLARRRRGT